MNIPVDWLLKNEDWISYRTRRDLLLESENNPQVVKDRNSMLKFPLIQTIIAELENWPGAVISSHKSSSQPFHKLTFLADVGFTRLDPGVENIFRQIQLHQSQEGPFQLPMMSARFAGDPMLERWAWALCDAPLILHALAKFGYENEPSVAYAHEYLNGLIRENGWPCAVSQELGNFRGPGSKADPCPFANLAMLKALSVNAGNLDSKLSRTGVEIILNLWSQREKKHPYIFYMGTDFCKLKAPFVWYDLLHVLDVLSCFEWVHNDERFLDMLAILQNKADSQSRFTAESIWTAWKNWEFGQKKQPSRWLTFLAWRILNRTKQQ